MCSRKWATPLLASVSKRLPELIHMPTVVVSANGMASVATRMPLGRVVTCGQARGTGKGTGPSRCSTQSKGAPRRLRTLVSGTVDSSGV